MFASFTVPRWLPVRWLVPALLFVLAFAVHSYRLPEHLFFGFEQGRDAQIAFAISRGQDFVLVGPKTDIGGVFHGPWYYYLMAIPYGLSGGNPLAAVGFLLLITSTLPVIMWLIGLELTKSKWWAFWGALISVMSYESVHYSRWLSNVTPALVGVPLVFLLLLYYHRTKQWWWLVGAASVAGFTAQFEIILTLWFGWLLLVLFFSGWLPKPSIKVWGLVVGAILVWFSPMVLFNVRNDWISWYSLQHYLNEGSAETLRFSNTALQYVQQLLRTMNRNLVGNSDWRWWMVLLTTVIGGGMVLKTKKDRSHVGFLFTWFTMTILVVFFPRSLSLPQLYLGTGLATVWIFVLAMRAWWQQPWGKVVAFVTIGLLITTWKPLLGNVASNRDVFFRTIQDDLNYRDQQAVLHFIHQDAAGKPYRLQAYTIPYFQDHGWRYLHDYFYPDHTEYDAKLIYVVIEKPVEAFWVKKWTEELGPTSLETTRQFGLLTVEKRLIAE